MQDSLIKESIENEIEQFLLNTENRCLLRRFFAMWIDYIVLSLFFYILYRVCVNAFYRDTVYYCLLAAILYFPLTEGFIGFTLGKFLLNITVIDSKGDRPGLKKAILRTLTKILEMNPLLGGCLLAGITAHFSKKCQRIGDMFAGTYVVDRSDLKNLKNNYSKGEYKILN